MVRTRWCAGAALVTPYAKLRSVSEGVWHMADGHYAAPFSEETPKKETDLVIKHTRSRRVSAFAILALLHLSADPVRAVAEVTTAPVFRAGAYAIDVSPPRLPAIVNGSMNERTADRILDPLHARCLVLDDGTHQLAIVVVDSCMMPRSLLDEAKAAAHQATGIPIDHILISATHTHSAPSAMPVLGSRRDDAYSRFLPGQIAKGIRLAFDQLAPARIGWAMGRDETNVACRRWLMKPGSLPPNPFGVAGERAKMHPGHGNPDAIRPTGPVDPDVAVLAVQTRDGRPLALVSNYSMHYVGGPAISADYFAVFCDEIGKRIGAEQSSPPLVAMLSNGTSGDAWCMDYSKPKRRFDRISVARDVAQAAHQAYQTIQYYDWVPLVMQERLLQLDVRMPTDDDVARAKRILAESESGNDDKPLTLEEVYAGETVALSKMPPSRELKLQAIRIGELGIATAPNEVFGSTGLAIKGKSPLPMTFVVSLANGAEGYIPPPDQFDLGGYTTWRARTSCLEESAESKIAQTCIELLQKVAQQRDQEKPVLSANRQTGVTDDREIRTATASRPLSVREALDAFHLHDSFRIELAAAEPLVADPVAYDWGPDGKLWVAEMGDYPLGLDNNGKPGGRVRYLEDSNGDGAYDKSTLFADNIPFPNGIAVWRNGVLVTAAPAILYLEDADGDGQADVRRPVFEGLTEGNPQLRANGLRWGLDGWLYCANGLSTVGEVRSVQNGESVSVRARDFRIDPDEGVLEPLLGTAQFGRSRDDWGNWFGVSNSNPMWHYVIADRYLRRNPHVTTPDCRRNVSTPPGKARVFSRSPPGVFFHDSEVGVFTSANSTIVFREQAYGGEFYQNLFVSEPTHNLIHRQIMRPHGVTFTSRRAPEEQTSEFLASSDPWFRPNMIRTGPDGALWFADMYREVIDHPQYIPEEFHAKLDFRNGDRLGRIYRVIPTGERVRSIPRIDALSDADLAGLMESPNGTVRDMAQKQIVWDQRSGAAPMLEKLAIDGQRATCRLQALWTLECLDLLKAKIVWLAMDDPSPGVRRAAVRLAEGKFERAPELGVRITEMLSDADPHVRLQIACTLGEWRNLSSAKALASLALQNAREPLVLTAVISSLADDNAGPVFDAVLSTGGELPELLVGQLFATAVGLNQLEVVIRSLEVVAAPADDSYATWQLGAMVALRDALGLRRQSFADLRRLDVSSSQSLSDKLHLFFEQARQIASDRGVRDVKRIRAVKLLGHQGVSLQEDRARLAKLLAPQEPAAIQTAAVDALAQLGGDEVADLLLEDWTSHSPQTRQQVLHVLLSRAIWTATLLDKMEAGRIANSDLDAAHRSKLAAHPDESLRLRAIRLLQDVINPDRQQVVEQWESALALPGNVQAGAAAFDKRCAVCHRPDAQGLSAGPSLAGLTYRSPKSFLLSVLDPNRTVDARYVNYLAITREGRSYLGVLVQESDSSLTIKSQDGRTHVVRREVLEELRCTGKSAMPEGLEKDMNPQEMADLIAYVSQMDAGEEASER